MHYIIPLLFHFYPYDKSYIFFFLDISFFRFVRFSLGHTAHVTTPSATREPRPDCGLLFMRGLPYGGGPGRSHGGRLPCQS